MTRHEERKYLYDIVEACQNIESFTQEMSLDRYLQELVIRSAVERQFLIVGEALGQAIRMSPDLAAKVTDADKIISFRNRLVHGYSSVSDEVVWGIVQGSLPRLLIETRKLLEEQ